jgi:hypothetical protein
MSIKYRIAQDILVTFPYITSCKVTQADEGWRWNDHYLPGSLRSLRKIYNNCASICLHILHLHLFLSAKAFFF